MGKQGVRSKGMSRKCSAALKRWRPGLGCRVTQARRVPMGLMMTLAVPQGTARAMERGRQRGCAAENP